MKIYKINRQARGSQTRTLTQNGPEAQNENKHSSLDKIWRLHHSRDGAVPGRAQKLHH